MKYRYSFVWILFLMLTLADATAQHFEVVRNNYEQVDISFMASPIETKVVKTAQGNFSAIRMEDYLLSSQVGKPQLPMMVQMLQIPVCDSVEIVVRNAQYEEVDASEWGIVNPIIPAQPSCPKIQSTEIPFEKDEAVYAQNAFYSESLVRVERIGTMRDVCLANIYVSPVSYNPVTNQLRIYQKIDVEVHFINANVPATYDLKRRYGSPMFQIASSKVANPMPRLREEYGNSPIKYLIIANSAFETNENLQQFAEWKKRTGYLVEVAYTSDPNVGTTTSSIKNFIKSEYDNATADNPAPTFLLLVGDVAQVPSFPSTEGESHVTDLYYACWTPNDNIPDCYYGRMSASRMNELNPQIEKTLMYEQFAMPDPSYLGKAVLVAGTDANWSPTHANGQINYVFNNYINTHTTNFDYTEVYQHLYNCSSQAATIREEIGMGVGWANYTAHGGETGWSNPGFSNTQIPNMHNENKYGIMIGNCCLTGKFDEASCFGEALLRADKKGAVAYIGASQVSYWDEDVYWAVGVRSNINANMVYQAADKGAYDCLFHTHNESRDEQVSSLGAFVASGNLSVQASTSGMKKYYWEIYHVFGDPSLQPYLGMPSEMTVASEDVVPIGATSYEVLTVPYAYVALTYDNELVAAAFANESGVAVLSFDPLTEVGQYELAVTAQNHIPYFKSLLVTVLEGPYVMASKVETTDNMKVGSDIHWNIVLKNVGMEAAANITAKMYSETPGFTVTQDMTSCAYLAQNDSLLRNNAFTIHISPDVEDMAAATLRVEITWDGGQFTKLNHIVAIAPNLKLKEYESHVGEGLSSFMPGDDVTMTFTTKNFGHDDVQNAIVDLTCNYSGVHVNTTSHSISWLGINDEDVTTFDIHIDNDVPTISVVPLYYHVLSGQRHTIDTVLLTVGNAIETFESSDFSAFNWQQGSRPWEIYSSYPYAGNYCARSSSGLADRDKSELKLSVNTQRNDYVSFFVKVSSEESYDKFYFYIDNEDVYEDSGIKDWYQLSFPVSVGEHKLKFSYQKDYSRSEGNDCAYIDNVVMPGVGTLVTEDMHDNVGIEDLTEGKTSVSVFPNPTKNFVTVRSTTSPISKILVYDVYGKLIGTRAVNETAFVLDMSSYPSGVYVIRVMTNNQSVFTNKIIKQ